QRIELRVEWVDRHVATVDLGLFVDPWNASLLKGFGEHLHDPSSRLALIHYMGWRTGSDTFDHRDGGRRGRRRHQVVKPVVVVLERRARGVALIESDKHHSLLPDASSAAVPLTVKRFRW